MISSIILLISATIGFLCTALILGKNKPEDHSLMNKYLIVIIAFQSCRFLVYGILQAYPTIEIRWLRNILDLGIIALMPCFYLYFKNIIHENRFNLGELIHFSVSAFFILIFFLLFIVFENNYVDIKIFLFTVYGFYLVYAYLSFKLMYKNVWSRKTEIKVIQKQNKLIKNWSIFLYVSFIVILTVHIMTGYFINKSLYFDKQFMWISALFWMGIYVKIILTPEILYGYNFLNKTIAAATEKVVLHSVWKIEGTVLPITSEKDKKLEKKITPLLMGYLHQIEELSFHSHAFRNPNLGLEDIADTLHIPISHINFIFKYHCNESFTDYKKIVRIHDGTKLLDAGYLNTHKVETLSAAVGFSSYNTFYLAFKSITGITTQEYVKRM